MDEWHCGKKMDSTGERKLRGRRKAREESAAKCCKITAIFMSYNRGWCENKNLVAKLQKKKEENLIALSMSYHCRVDSMF